MAAVDSKPFIIRKRFGKWCVYVRSGTISTIGFRAPFKTFEDACSYVRHYLERKK